jgi:ATP-binding cassette subfamily C protein
MPSLSRPFGSLPLPALPSWLRRRRVHTPTRLQMEATECGAAALGIVLAHFGRWVLLEELRVACGVSRDGSRASNIVKAGRQYHLAVSGYHAEPTGLRELPLPLIVFWRFNHFLVVEGFGRGVVYLNDPAIGPRTVSATEFDEGFTGVVLTCEPGPDFQRGGAKPGLLPALARRLAHSKQAIVYLLAAGLGLVGLGLLIPAFTRVFVDRILVGGQGGIVVLLAIMALAAVLRALLTGLQQHCLLRLEARLAVSMASGFFWHVLHLPIEFFAQRYAGEIGARVGINDRVARLLAGDLANLGLSLSLIAFYAVLMYQYDPLLTALGVGIALVNLLVLRAIARRRVDVSQRLLMDRAELLRATMGGLQTIETIKATGRESDFFARWAGFHARALNSQQRAGLVTQPMLTLPTLLAALSAAATLTLGGLRVMDGTLTMGMLVAFQTLMASFLAPVTQLMSLGGALQDAEGDLGRLDDVLHQRTDPWLAAPTSAGDATEGSHADVLDRPGKPLTPRPGKPLTPRPPLPCAGEGESTRIGGVVSGPGARSWRDGLGVTADGERLRPAQDSDVSTELPVQERLTGYLELRDVTFGYSRLEPPLIESISLSLRPGDRVALVGRSGSGKSTLAKLVAGLYEPWAGQILFDGRPRASIARGALTGSVATVDQEIFLFEGTIRDNLTLWDTSIPEQAVVQAARDAAIHDEIVLRSGGYEHVVEEGGRNFSGGQRQRLEIARALAGNPAVLVLDEATSALDPLTERAVEAALRRRGCTCLIVAHRLSTIRDCEEIVVLEGGKIVQRGTHDELIRLPGPYATLIRSEEYQQDSPAFALVQA